ncbi:short-chain dehydrogenase/reductase [Aspergillus caelatus]|uniref:Short-chain dehydrogenase/reductase n=1 Tax=Aspergillus caelatus TaxID=61420 RepID=A0A5N7A4W2_9EURO|nr:short-chain dehydrogenase/reductase [Aspergillus caelatus]KAE8364901.1 short-chain dehydrogenase/reductase [Aspergillus caelatus]
MVSLSTVRAHNALLKSLGSGLVAVFVGGTSGIGLYTAREFVRYTISPTVYLVGRNETQARQVIQELSLVNPSGKFQFIQTDASLLSGVDSACEVIQQKENRINLLFLSCGIFTLKGRDETSEGLDKKFSLHYYARMRFINNLIPQLTQANSNKGSTSALSRVITVLGAGHETKIDMNDLDLKHKYSLDSCDVHATTMSSLMVEEFASRYPSTTFIHTYPGIVKSGISREAGPIVGRLVRAVMFLGRPWMVAEQESGERHLGDSRVHAAVSRRGAYLVKWDGSEVGDRRFLDEYHASGVGRKVWEHTEEMLQTVLKRR